MSYPAQILKTAFETLGIERTLRIEKPGPLYGVEMEEITVQDIGQLTVEKLFRIADKTLDLYLPFLIIGGKIMFYSQFLAELRASNDQ